MFRNFFTRKYNGQSGGTPHQTPEQREQAASILNRLREMDEAASEDGVHRMAVRAGNEPLPDDPDERLFGQESGDHAQIARAALAAGEFARSVYHLGLALADGPGRDDLLALLDQWIAAAGPNALDFVPLTDPRYVDSIRAARQMMRMGNTREHPMEVVPVVGERYHTKVAVHAYILASQGRLREAVTLLLDLVEAKPEIPYYLWLERWRGKPSFDAALDPDRVAAIVSQIVPKYPGTYVFAEDARNDMQRYLPVCALTYAAHPDHPHVGGMYALLLRKCGHFDEALRIAHTLAPSYSGLVALAMAQAAVGELDASINTYRRTLVVETKDVGARNDIANTYLLMGELDAALAGYEESLRLDPKDPYQQAAAYVAYLTHLLRPQSGAIAALDALAKRQHIAMRLRGLLDAPYVGRLPHASESFINLLRTVRERLAEGTLKPDALTDMKVACTIVESPSARLAFSRALAALGGTATFTVQAAPHPDTRQPLRPVEYQIWTYRDMDPMPNVSPPAPEIATQLADLARRPYALDALHAPARTLGQRLGPGAMEDLLAALAHPPVAPQGWEQWDWIAAVQLAAALTIAYVDEGWEGSRRRAALTSLMYGPMDWSGAAAITATALLARQDERIAIDFDHLCLDLWGFAPDDGPWALEEALVHSLYYLGTYSDAITARLKEHYERQQAANESKQV